jgi:hypothetical protein
VVTGEGGFNTPHGLVPIQTGEGRGWQVAPRYSGGGGVNGFESDSNLNGFKFLQNAPNFNRSKNDPPLFGKIEIKYGFEGLKEMNNFHHRNFFIYGFEGFEDIINFRQ